MTLPASGTISFNAINVELGVAGTTPANINQSSYRTLAGKPSGAIALSDFYGKSNRISRSVTISSNTSNYVVNTAKASGYIPGGTDFTLIINSGVFVSSASTGSYALTVDTSWAAGDTVTIINNGVIIGRGGNGGAGNSAPSYFTVSYGSPGGVGGPALLVQRATSINNVNRIAGGGGGGGGGAGYRDFSSGSRYGGGGGGGIGVSSGGSSVYADATGGTLTTSGTGGYGDFEYGGNGGTYGSSGFAANSTTLGGAGGAAIVGNSNITWIATGTRNGSIS